MLNLQFIADYLIHRLSSKTRHGVHSPFVYNLLDKIIYDFHAKEVYKPIEELRAKLLKDKRFINTLDMGAGSLINPGKKKQVKMLAANALKPQRLAQLIYRLAHYFNPAKVVELGTCLGITTSYLAKAIPDGRIISVEGCPETAAVAAENFKSLSITNVDLLTGNFDKILPEIIKTTEVLEFVFIDGNHRKEATLNYFKACMPRLSNDSIMIFDDIYWSRGMKDAWQEIKDHPQVTLTIDLFWIGLVFIRKEQLKEHFKIKF